jgi:ABC-2 type transport system permease protein
VADSIKLYLMLIGAHARSRMQYRLSFALDVAGTALISLLDFALVLILFHNAPLVGGWTVHEVALLYGMAAVSFGCANLLVGHVEHLPEKVRDGTFDLVLVRPRGTLFQMVTSDFVVRQIGKILQAVGVLVWALATVHVDWTLGRALLLPVALICGVVIFSAVFVAGSCIAFFVIDAREMQSAFTYGGSFLTQYPITIYGPWLRRLLAFIVPMAFVAYAPASYILGKDESSGLPDWAQLASPLAAAGAALAVGLLWRVCVRHYRSAGG